MEPGTTVKDVAAVVFRRKRVILVVFLAVLAGELAGARWVRRAARDGENLIAAHNGRKAAEESLSLHQKKYAEAEAADKLNQERALSVPVAEPERTPAPVNRVRLWPYVAVGALVAAVGAAASGYVAERLDHSVHTPRELENLTSLTVLACIPDSRAS